MSETTNEKGTKTTIWQLLQQYEIIIPIIQRDYAQGREKGDDVAQIREQILDDLCDAVKMPNGNLVLDYIYGSIKDGRLLLIDGQQRLTTLWLLHIYFAWKENIQDRKLLEKFSYEVRDTATEFCEKLAVNSVVLSEEKSATALSTAISETAWFHLSYKSDPTILAMLNMLDCIHTHFAGVENGWKRLTKENAVTFWQLSMADFSLTDDLYIKMNARGKRLSAFENFKSFFEQKLDEHTEHLSSGLIEHWKDSIDNDWLDFFYKRSDNNPDKAETAMYRLILFFLSAYAFKENLWETFYTGSEFSYANVNAFNYSVVIEGLLQSTDKLSVLGNVLNWLSEDKHPLRSTSEDTVIFLQSEDKCEYREFVRLYGKLRYIARFPDVMNDVFTEFERVLGNLITGERELNTSHRGYQTSIDIKAMPRLLKNVDTLIDVVNSPEQFLDCLAACGCNFKTLQHERDKIHLVRKDKEKLLALENTSELRGLVHNFLSDDKQSLLLSAGEFSELLAVPKGLLLRAIQCFSTKPLWFDCGSGGHPTTYIYPNGDTFYCNYYGFTPEAQSISSDILWTNDKDISEAVHQFLTAYSQQLTEGTSAEDTVKEIVKSKRQNITDANSLVYYLVHYDAFLRTANDSRGCAFLSEWGSKFAFYRLEKADKKFDNTSFYNPFYLAMQEKLEKIGSGIRVKSRIKHSGRPDDIDSLETIELSDGRKIRLDKTGVWHITKPDGFIEMKDWQGEDRIAKIAEWLKNVALSNG